MSKKLSLFLLFLLIAFFVISNFLILQDMFHPLGKDWHAHLKHSLRIIKEFKVTALLAHPRTAYRDFLMLDQDYPPLYHAISAGIFSVLGVKFMFMTSTLFLIILICSTYKIGKLLKDETSGLFSAIAVSFYPIIYLSSRDFNLELAQAALVCLSLYCLLRSDDFKNTKYSFLSGVVFAAGMLIKQQFFLFILGPLLVTSFKTLKNLRNPKITLLNLVAFLAPFGLITFYLFYFIYLNGDVLKHFFMRTNSTSELQILSTNWFNFSHLLFYIKALKVYQIGIVNLLFALICAPFFYFRKEPAKYRAFFAGWFFVPAIWLTLIPTKYNEYTISCLPVLALITGLAVSLLRNLFVRAGIIIFYLIFNLFLFVEFLSPWKNTSFLKGNDKRDLVLNELRVYRTPASTYATYNYSILKAENPDFNAIRFLSGMSGDKKQKIGVASYVTLTGFLPATEIELLFPLYNRHDEIGNLIFAPAANPPDEFDTIIFVSEPGRKGERWINKDQLVKQLSDYNNYQLGQQANKKINDHDKNLLFGFYFLHDDPSATAPAPNYCPVSTIQIDKVVKIYPKLRLIKEIDGMSRPDILIYKRMEKSG